MRLRSTNPVYSKMGKMDAYQGVDFEAASYRGIASKTFYFAILVIIGAFLGIYLLSTNPDALGALLPITVIVGFICSLVAFISPASTKIAGTIYCLCEGMLVGIVSILFETIVPGVVVAGLLGTVAVVFVVATLYLTGMVKVTGKFVRFLLIFSISVILCQLFLLILSLVSPGTFGGIFNSFGSNLLVSGIMIFLATLYLMFDMENIRQVVEGGQPKQLEWFASFGLIFTIVWLYMEILPLIARIMLRDN
jgi:uncharacterized YccA/Bax inhibitor family protein